MLLYLQLTKRLDVFRLLPSLQLKND